MQVMNHAVSTSRKDDPFATEVTDAYACIYPWNKGEDGRSEIVFINSGPSLLEFLSACHALF